MGTGAKSEMSSKTAARKFARILQKLNYQVKWEGSFKVQNVVGSADVGFPIRLEGVANTHSSKMSYEPELFPGLIFRIEQPKVVALMFVTGKIVFTGAKSTEQINQAYDIIYPVALQNKKYEVAID